MTFNIKYTLNLEHESLDKEINIRNRISEYDACSSLNNYLTSKYPDYKSHNIISCESIDTVMNDDDAVNYLRNIFGMK